MRRLNRGAAALSAVFLSQAAIGQMATVKSFDYTILESKTLYIPEYQENEKYIQRLTKKGKYDEIEKYRAMGENYNEIWTEAMAESSYDATDYEIRAFDAKELFKSKDEEAMILSFSEDDYGNLFASLMVTGPKKKLVASTPVNTLDLTDKGDIRLMINMLNESMNTAAEIDESGDNAKRKTVVNKYKKDLVEWAEGMEDKTFMVPESDHDNPEKAAKRDEALQEALTYWTMSKTEFTTQDAIDAKRVEGDSDYYYWRSIPIYSNLPVPMNYNLILSADGDDLIMAFMGKNRLKPSAIEQIQKKFTLKVEKYKKQLED